MSKTDASGERLKEAQFINKSLSAIGDVVAALSGQQGKGKKGHVPYRNSKLTYLLQDSLENNAKGQLIVWIQHYTLWFHILTRWLPLSSSMYLQS